MYTPEYIKERLRGNGVQSIFEEQVLKYIEHLENEVKELLSIVEAIECQK